MVAAVGTTTANPIKADRKTTYVSNPETSVDKRVTASENKLKALEDIKLFDLKADTFVKTATATATKAPVREVLQAALGSSYNPLFISENTGKNKEQKDVSCIIDSSSYNGNATKNALTEIEMSSGLSDKQNEGHIFLVEELGLTYHREKHCEKGDKPIFIAYA